MSFKQSEDEAFVFSKSIEPWSGHEESRRPAFICLAVKPLAAHASQSPVENQGGKKGISNVSLEKVQYASNVFDHYRPRLMISIEKLIIK